jgi:plasmid stabilization system protein ParE
MTRQVVLTAMAENGRDETFAFYAKRSKSGAWGWYATYAAVLQTLAIDADRFPLAREAATLNRSLRQADFGTRRTRPTHRLLFEIDGERVVVVALLHNAQRDFEG